MEPAARPILAQQNPASSAAAFVSKGDWPIELLTDPISGNMKVLTDISDPAEGLPQRKVGHMVCAAISAAVSEEVAVCSPCSCYFDHISRYLFQINKYIRWVMQITVCARSYLIYYSPTNIR